MNHAKETDFEAVKEIFYQHKKWFPHIRTDYMKRMIAKNNLIYDNDGVDFTWLAFRNLEFIDTSTGENLFKYKIVI